ncbi:MAG: hypothetical protein II897_03925 [Clostridia bacterium]|nr:hypothetical protein [Clostridia bacterium]
MAYIDKTYYDDTFHGTPIPNEEFSRLADIASDVIFGICVIKPTAANLSDEHFMELFQKAVGYQVELLYLQGGIDAIVGLSEAACAGESESLGDYSVSSGSQRHEAVRTFNGIPVSSMAYMLLSELGLMCRWAYAGRYRHVCS